MQLNSITEILTDIRHGKMVILVDDEDRENEGDLVMAAEHATAESVNFMAKYARGLICLSLTPAHCQQLGLAMMVENNQTPYQTAFTVSIEAAKGVTTGISAQDRAHTIRTAVRENVRASDIVQPGHIFPLKAKHGGVLARAGHTEASVDCAHLAGLHPSAVICEILNDDGTMARLPELIAFAQTHQLKIGSIADLIEYRMTTERLVERIAHYPITIEGFDLRLHLFREHHIGAESALNDPIHIAITHGTQTQEALFNPTQGDIVVRVQYPLTLLDFIDHQGLGTQTRYPWQKCLRTIAQSPAGVLLGMRSFADEQAKIRQYANAQAPETLRWDSRIYGAGAQILHALGVRKMRLLSQKVNLANLKGFGLEISGFEEW